MGFLARTAIFLFSLCIFVLLFAFVQGDKGYLRDYKLFVVQSGSMQPSVNIGDLVLVRKFKKYLQGDTITFSDNRGRLVTHRVSSINKQGGSLVYITKGDANQAQDEDFVAFGDIVGKVILVIPKLGYLASWSKSLYGIVFLIYLPSLFIILREIHSLLDYVFKD